MHLPVAPLVAIGLALLASCAARDTTARPNPTPNFSAPSVSTGKITAVDVASEELDDYTLTLDTRAGKVFIVVANSSVEPCVAVDRKTLTVGAKVSWLLPEPKELRGAEENAVAIYAACDTPADDDEFSSWFLTATPNAV